MPQNKNPFLSQFLMFYSQSEAGNGLTRGLENELAKKTYVKTQLDRKLADAILDGQLKLVILTGNAGDGKTAFIQMLENAAVERGANLDAKDEVGSTFTIDGRGWYRTGDNVEIDEEGYVFYTGRADDIINSSGYRIGPQEVENALTEHEAVLECAVVGVPDEERGELVKAWIVLAPGFAESAELVKELQDHAKAVTAPYKYPRQITFAEDLPKTVSGKIRRNILRERK